MFVNVFLYHFEKGKSVKHRWPRGILTISQLGYLRNPQTAELHHSRVTFIPTRRSVHQTLYFTPHVQLEVVPTKQNKKRSPLLNVATVDR